MSTTTSPHRSPGNALLTLLIIAIIIVGGIWLLNRHSHETVGDRIGNAIDAAPAKFDDAADELTDKDTYRKTGDQLQDAGAAASSALSKAGAATSQAISQTSADLKAAADKQKEQNAEASSSKANN